MAATAITINIFCIKINSIENGSAVNVGHNLLSDWTNSDKRNQGFGQSYGDGSDFVATRSCVDDRDALDAPSQKTTNAIPGIVEEVPTDVHPDGH